MNNTEMLSAVVDCFTIRKFLIRMKSQGGDVYISTPVAKHVAASDGTKIFEALKTGYGWHCQIHPMFVNDLKICFK
jgi:hypothetical protein